MKFTAAALLVATVAAADPTGCKKGIKMEYFDDDKCTKKVDTSKLTDE